jgi:hypothetical protein
MSPDLRTKPTKPTAASDIYTVLVVAAFLAVFATFLFVAAKSYFQYGSLFSIP